LKLKNNELVFIIIRAFSFIILNMEILRACYIKEIVDDCDPQKLMTFYHAEKSQQLKEMPKYIAFNQWCDDNGILRPGVDFPAAFGLQGQLIGMAAAKDIAPGTAFLYVPQEMQINKFTIEARAPEIPKMFEQNAKAFEKHHDSEYMMMVVYIFYEKMKGSASFWYPYL
jgi:hypothetical protein